VMETLLRTAEAMVDGARLEGRFGYVRALRRRLRPSVRFRLAQFLHSRFHIDRPLTFCMMERFEMLMIAHLVTLSLIRFMHERLEPTLGSRISEIVSEVLWRQRRTLDDALETVRLHYHGYSEALEHRILQQIALRLEGEEYDQLLNENLVSEELHRELLRDVERRRARVAVPLRFDLRNGIEHRLRRFPAFREVPDDVLHDLAKAISLHFASPGEVLIKRGRRIRTIYAVIAGLAELHVAEHDVHFAEGDLIGAWALIHEDGRARGTIRSLQFGHMLAIPAARFERLVAQYPSIRQAVERRQPGASGSSSAALLALDEGAS
jgi:CPA1 family monovalent cation:H+ antiporter